MTRGQVATINGTRLYFEDVGAGEPILFSHCLLWNSTMYDAQIAALQGKYRCVAFDHRGQGRSEDFVCDEISVEMLCDDAAAFIRYLDLPPVHFVGHSLGGFVGIALAVKYPELVRSLILCNTSADAERKENLLKYRLLNTLGRYVGSSWLADLIVPMIFDAEVLTTPGNPQKFGEVIRSNRRTVWRAVNGVINRRSQMQSLPQVSARTLVVTGNGDTMRIRRESEQLAAGIRGAQFVSVPNANHMLPLERPDVFTELIEKFIEDRTTSLSES